MTVYSLGSMMIITCLYIFPLVFTTHSLSHQPSLGRGECDCSGAATLQRQLTLHTRYPSLLGGQGHFGVRNLVQLIYALNKHWWDRTGDPVTA